MHDTSWVIPSSVSPGRTNLDVYKRQGKKQVDSDGIIAGDIGAVAKLVSAKTGDTLCDACLLYTSRCV